MTKRVGAALVFLLLAFTVVSHAEEQATTPALAANPFVLAEDLSLQSGWSPDQAVELRLEQPLGRSARPRGRLLHFEREVLLDDVAHYTAELRIGDGAYDFIRIHRVVKELRPYRPVRTHKNVFLLHGDAVGFVKFLFGLASPNAPDERSAALYLAQQGIDVWGMDQDWILVPADTSDFDFMADWGMQHQVDNLNVALRVARYTRLFTGNGFAKMNLLGYSSGAATVYALANQETQLPPGLRQIGGLIPVDLPYKLDPGDENGQAFGCAYAASLQAAIDAGVYEDATGTLFWTLGTLGQTDPDGSSPIFPGFTNLQAAMFAVGVTYQLFPANDWWHYMGAQFTEEGVPVDLTFTPVQQALDFLVTASPYEPARFPMEYTSLWCNDDLPFDDHLGEIVNPLLYIGAAGGLGMQGFYTTTLVGSDDVTLLNPALLSPEEIALDIGHIDIWTAEQAPELFWQPLADWIFEHSRGHGREN